MSVDFASYLLSSSPPAFSLPYNYGGFVALDIGTNCKNDAYDLHSSVANVIYSNACKKVTSWSNWSDCSIPADDDKLFRMRAHTVPKTLSDKRSCCKKETTVRKRVSFADDIGLNLVSVRVVENSDSPPTLTLPPTLLSIVNSDEGETESSNTTSPTSKKASSNAGATLLLNFSQPCTNNESFLYRVQTSSVALEKVTVNSGDSSFSGTILVKNIAFEKTVRLRVTLNDWFTHFEVAAMFLETANDSKSIDRFIVTVPVPHCAERAQFAVCYEVKGTEYWDNNFGANYIITNMVSEDRRDAVFTLNSPEIVETSSLKCRQFLNKWSHPNYVPYW